MRDEEIEALLLNARPRGLSDDDRRRMLEEILAAGGRHRTAWWQRPIPLWKVAAVLVPAAAAIWFGLAPRSGGASGDGPWGREDAVATTVVVRHAYAPVDPVVFRDEQESQARTGGVRAWQVLTPPNAKQVDEED